MATVTQYSRRFFTAPAALLRFAREARDELKKVSWPSREATLRYTLVVILSSAALAAITSGIDYLFSRLLETVIL